VRGYTKEAEALLVAYAKQTLLFTEKHDAEVPAAARAFLDAMKGGPELVQCCTCNAIRGIKTEACICGDRSWLAASPEPKADERTVEEILAAIPMRTVILNQEAMGLWKHICVEATAALAAHRAEVERLRQVSRDQTADHYRALIKAERERDELQRRIDAAKAHFAEHVTHVPGYGCQCHFCILEGGEK